MAGFINSIYVKFIRPVDPGLFITRYAFKAAVACFGSFLAAIVLGIEGTYLFWWMVGAVCTILFRTGSTLTRRKMYALILLSTVVLVVPFAALAGSHAYWGLVFIFCLAFCCFFVASMGVSAATLGIGCLVVSLISVFSPVDMIHGILRSACLLPGGLISFGINFYLWPFDPEKVLLSSATLAVEDMGFFFEGLVKRIKNPDMGDGSLARLSSEAVVSVRRYRVFMESFNIDPLRGSPAAGGPGLFYFTLIRLFESITGLMNHIHFSDGRPGFLGVQNQFHRVAEQISLGFYAFSRMESGHYEKPDFEKIMGQIRQVQDALLDMGAYRRGDEVRDDFLDAWGAIYELKNVADGLKGMMGLADDRFRLGRS